MNASPNTPSTPSEDEIATFLQDQSTWRGGPTELWREALDHTANDPVPVRKPGIMPQIRRVAPLAVAACIVLVAGTAIMMPSLGKARQSARQLRDQRIDSKWVPEDAPAADAITYQSASSSRLAGESADSESRVGFASGDAQSSKVDQAAAVRMVIRKATIELTTVDVRTAFSKAQLLLRPEVGEFAEGSTLTGEGPTARAQLTLRVAADRLSAVLTQLRDLGKVTQENSTGDDVTTQAVDLDARLRNERRVETELLQLLESRKDAPLKEILDLRENLSRIRGEIEQLQGRRDTLGRQVSLATILVIIQAEAKPPEPEKPAGASAFLTDAGKSFTSAFTNGAKTLVASLAFLAELAIAGAFWWTLLAIAAVMIRRRLINQPKVSIGLDPTPR